MIPVEELENALPNEPVRVLKEAIEAPKIASGKVRDVFDLKDSLLLVATDRISAFDVVLPGGIPGRGMILTQISRYWFGKTRRIVRNHLLPKQAGILRDRLGLSRDSQLRSMAVRKLKPLAIECVARGYLAGSGWLSYQQTGSVCGIALPSGLNQASRLPEPIFTPTTKAKEGHDMPITEEEAREIVGSRVFEQAKRISMELYALGRELAGKVGILLADTKFEFGLDEAGNLCLIDEVLTPDSSRYWEAADWSEGISPPSFDKQIVRDYLETLDWNKKGPGPELPNEIVDRTQKRYLEVYRRLTAPRGTSG